MFILLAHVSEKHETFFIQRFQIHNFKPYVKSVYS